MKYTKTKTEKKLLKKVTINVTISDLEIEAHQLGLKNTKLLQSQNH